MRLFISDHSNELSQRLYRSNKQTKCNHYMYKIKKEKNKKIASQNTKKKKRENI